MPAPIKIEGPYRVHHDTDLQQWEVKFMRDGELVELFPRRIYSYAGLPDKENIKRAEAYKIVARWNRKWQEANKPEGDDNEEQIQS